MKPLLLSPLLPPFSHGILFITVLQKIEKCKNALQLHCLAFYLHTGILTTLKMSHLLFTL